MLYQDVLKLDSLHGAIPSFVNYELLDGCALNHTHKKVIIICVPHNGVGVSLGEGRKKRLSVLG